MHDESGASTWDVNFDFGNHNAKLYLQGSNNDIYMGQRNGSPNQAYSPHNIDTKVYNNKNNLK